MSILVYVDHLHGVQPNRHPGRSWARPVSWRTRLGKPLVASWWATRSAICRRKLSAMAPTRCWSPRIRPLASSGPGVSAAALKAAIKQSAPDIILLDNSFSVRDMAALAACELNIGLAADCQDLELDAAGNLQAVRPVYSGNILATIVFQGKPQDGHRAQSQLSDACSTMTTAQGGDGQAGRRFRLTPSSASRSSGSSPPSRPRWLLRTPASSYPAAAG